MKDAGRIVEVRGTLKTAPIGSCIYCGATDQLTDEHIIPRALAGRYVLSKSSCPKCATITSTFERSVLRGFMLDARTVAGYPTRRPKERPKSLALQIERSGAIEQIELKPSEHPGFLYLPQLEPAGILAGRQPSVGMTVKGIKILYFGKQPHQVARDLGTKTLQITTNCDFPSFGRVLAKIGYSYAVAARGPLPREDVPVLPLILGRADDASTWLGSANFQLAIEERHPLHAFGTEWVPDPTDANNLLLIARVKLFVPSGTPGYEVVVCRSLSTSTERSENSGLT